MANDPAFGLLSFNRAAKLLGVHPSTARRLLRDPSADFPRPTVKIGRRRFYRSSDELRAWLDRQAHQAAG